MNKAHIRKVTSDDLLARNYPGGLRDVQNRFSEMVKDLEPLAEKGAQYRDLIDHPAFQHHLQWLIEQQTLKNELLKAIDLSTDKRLEASYQVAAYEEVIQHLIDVIKRGDKADKDIQDGEEAVNKLKTPGG